MPKNKSYSEASPKSPKGEQRRSERGPRDSGVIPVPREVIDGTAGQPKPGEYCPPGTPPVDPRA